MELPGGGVGGVQSTARVGDVAVVTAGRVQHMNGRAVGTAVPGVDRDQVRTPVHVVIAGGELPLRQRRRPHTRQPPMQQRRPVGGLTAEDMGGRVRPTVIPGVDGDEVGGAVAVVITDPKAPHRQVRRSRRGGRLDTERTISQGPAETVHLGPPRTTPRQDPEHIACAHRRLRHRHREHHHTGDHGEDRQYMAGGKTWPSVPEANRCAGAQRGYFGRALAEEMVKHELLLRPYRP